MTVTKLTTHCEFCHDTKKVYDPLHFKSVPCICNAGADAVLKLKEDNAKIDEFNKQRHIARAKRIKENNPEGSPYY